MDLIGKLEKASGPCPSLDKQIEQALKRGVFTPIADDTDFEDALEIVHRSPGRDAWPRYTASIDAAITLVPEGWEWMASNRAPKPKAGRAYIHNKEPLSTGLGGLRDNPKYRGHEATAATPALAMCIVGLMARR